MVKILSEAGNRSVFMIYKNRDIFFSLPKAVIHCFTGTVDEAKKYVEMGLYIGLTGMLILVIGRKYLFSFEKKAPYHSDAKLLFFHSMRIIICLFLRISVERQAAKRSPGWSEIRRDSN